MEILEPPKLLISKCNGTVRFLHSDITIFEGVERLSQLEAGFEGGCGVSAEFKLKGAMDGDSFELSGTGDLRVGNLRLCNATVKARPSGVTIDVPVGRAHLIRPLRITLGATPGSWRGIIEFNEPLQCLVIGPQMLRASLTFEVASDGATATCLATAELDQARMEIPLTQKPEDCLAGEFIEVKRLLLAAVAERLTEELTLNERQLNDNLDEPIFEGLSTQDYRPPAERSSVEAQPSAPYGGYLPRPAARAGVAPRQSLSPNDAGRYLVEMSNTSLKGYLSEPERLVNSGSGGYLSIADAERSMGKKETVLYGGYVPRPDSQSDASLSRGYVGTHEAERRYWKTVVEDRPMSFVNQASAAVFEVAAYRTLWCKDLLQAIGNAASQDY